MLRFSIRLLLVIIAVAAIMLAGATFVWRHFEVYHRFIARSYTVDGPVSSAGWKTKIRVDDAGPTWSADWYASVEVYDRDGTLVASLPRRACHSYEQFQEFSKSVVWTGPDFIESSSGYASRQPDGNWLASLE